MSIIKDSGTRQEFETGSVRDIGTGKGRFDLIPFLPHEKLAIHFEAGIKKYGERNWEKGQTLKTYLDSGERHLLKFMNGERDEDHLSASVWNNYAYQWTENEIIEGRLPYTLTDNLNPKLLKYIDDKIEQRLGVRDGKTSGRQILADWKKLFELSEPKFMNGERDEEFLENLEEKLSKDNG